MQHAWKIMKESAVGPTENAVRSMGGLIGGEAKKLNEHRAKGKSIKQKCEFVMPPPVPEDEEPSAPTPRVPKQLSLFNLDEL